MRKLETEHGIFTDLVNDEGEILKTAEEVYEGYLKQLEQIDICPSKTTEEKLEELVEQVTMMDELIANLTLEVIENE